MGQVSLRGIRKSYDATEVIRGIDLDVLEGEFLVFVGPSGCGKSTTLRMIAGLETISGGDLLIDGTRANDLRPCDRGAAMVFQSYALYPHMTVAENMGFALKMAGVSRAKRNEQVRKTADVLRITDLLGRYPKELSGGQRQRVAIGRAIVRKPKVFLFDEPLSNLDAALRVDMRIELSRLHKELRTTMIYVTHDQVEAMTMGDRIAVFNRGKIEQIGGPMDLYNRPANEFVAGFIGSPRINFIDRPEEGKASVQHVALWQGLARDAHEDARRLGIRPEHVGIGAPEHGVQATVELVEQLGDSAMVHLRMEGMAHLLIAKVAASDGVPCAGQAVGLLTGVAHKALAFDNLGKLLAVR
ncbi:MAG: sn-glycerol-3-phosphate ABC transporter ATP-binding protein UgpC [Burkholderiaceae bacterium]|nr:sn-glycerol-3-phosphate ABC transporter ATP-binding protein UgpC [Burkholderiaceae bacterium]